MRRDLLFDAAHFQRGSGNVRSQVNAVAGVWNGIGCDDHRGTGRQQYFIRAVREHRVHTDAPRRRGAGAEQVSDGFSHGVAHEDDGVHDHRCAATMRPQMWLSPSGNRRIFTVPNCAGIVALIAGASGCGHGAISRGLPVFIRSSSYDVCRCRAIEVVQRVAEFALGFSV